MNSQSAAKVHQLVTAIDTCSVLIVEDEADILDLLNDVLLLEGFGVMTASTPMVALDMVKRDCPDVILMDLMLPGMSGFELAEAVHGVCNTPIIAMSASNFLLHEAQRWTHFAAAMAKPFDWDQLIDNLRRYRR